jgi:hypothetical protein
MKSLRWAVVACVAMCVAGGAAADTIWDYQAVDSLGYGTHALVGAVPDDSTKVTIEGLVIGGTEDFVNRNAAFAMYSLWIQDDGATKGGIQCWTGPWSDWSAYPIIAASTRVRVTGWLANNNGKVFMNDRHSPALLWTVEVLDAAAGMPEAQVISSISECNYFDATRAGGGELYQTRWVELNNVEITSGTWGAGNSVTISDGTGTLTMLLSGMGDFNSFAAPTGKFNVVGVFDQEDTNADGDYQDMYRLWVKDAGDITPVPEPCTLTLAGLALAGGWAIRRKRAARGGRS